MLARVSSPRVVGVHRRGTLADTPYFVMDFVPFTVHRLIHEDFDGGPVVDYELCVRILRQTLEGLQAIHDRQWTHRDVKPKNILLTEDDDVRLADFGIMKDPRLARTEVGKNPGTLGWTAPEQERGETVTPAADVYSFGLVASRMISGEDDARSTDLTRFTDRATADLIESCLAPSPDARPTARDVLVS